MLTVLNTFRYQLMLVQNVNHLVPYDTFPNAIEQRNAILLYAKNHVAVISNEMPQDRYPMQHLFEVEILDHPNYNIHTHLYLHIHLPTTASRLRHQVD